jgi:hypothetical protein
MVQQQTYTGTPTQQWKLKNLGNNTVELSLPDTDLALAIIGSSKEVGANLGVETYADAPNQKWTIRQLLGTTEIVNVNSGMAVNILGYQKQPGIQLVQQNAGYVANQVWSFYPIPLQN